MKQVLVTIATFIIAGLITSRPLLAQEKVAVITDPVTTQSGKVSGVMLNEATGLQVFRGIPYAAAPVGDLRWCPPQPPKPWAGVRVCDEFGDVCWQSMTGRSDPPTMSEDCLYLNVWTKSVGDAEKLPVMVWIHGGGLSRGWSHQAMYDGSALAEQGVVLISINYRLGPYGFLAHPELSAESPHGVSGNYGFLDQIESLKWVRNNIAAFGGDPNNVTIFGESAGGTSVGVLCSSPLAKDLFHRAILQSPWMFGFVNDVAEPNFVHLKHRISSTPSAEELGTAWASKFVEGASDGTLKELRALPTEKLIADGVYYETRPTMDGWCLPKHPAIVFAEGAQANIPTIIGTTSHEGNYFTSFLPKTRDDLVAKAREFYGDRATSVLASYPGDAEAAYRTDGSAYITDSWFVQPARQLLMGMSTVSSPAFQYEFTRHNRKSPALGAAHASELKTVFGTLGESATPADHQLSKTMMQYWTQFVRTGNPNGGGLPTWPKYGDEQTYLELGETIQTGRQLKKGTLDVLDRATAGIYALPKQVNEHNKIQ